MDIRIDNGVKEVSDFACRICNNKSKIRYMMVKERMLNKGDVFSYAYCPKCGALQLVDEVDVSRFYEENYYSFEGGGELDIKKTSKFAKYLFINTFIGASFDYLFDTLGLSPLGLSIVRGTHIEKDSRILDVGGGNGFFAYILKLHGYENVKVIDRFCTCAGYDVNFEQVQITDINEENLYDLIMFNNSFEHMNNPNEILEAANRLLKVGGYCTLFMPVSENVALKQYGENFWQIDAPRHYFLYTKRAIKYLINNKGWKMIKVIGRAGCNQFIMSKGYQDTNYSFKELNDRNLFGDYSLPKKIVVWFRTILSNILKNGESLLFVLQKTEDIAR